MTGLVEEDKHVLIIVVDKGKGIIPEDRERIFERFYRSDGRRKGEGSASGFPTLTCIMVIFRSKVPLMWKPCSK